jgi:hypothetical protein
MVYYQTTYIVDDEEEMNVKSERHIARVGVLISQA